MCQKKITGQESAYPSFFKNPEITDKGISIMLKLASQAPDCIPLWFKHDEPEKNWKYPEKSDRYNMTEHLNEIETINSWLNETIKELPDELKWFQTEYEAAEIEEEKWKIENEKERYFQWRFYWANQMIIKYNSVLM